MPCSLLQDKFNYDVAVMLLPARSTLPVVKLVGPSSEAAACMPGLFCAAGRCCLLRLARGLTVC